MKPLTFFHRFLEVLNNLNLISPFHIFAANEAFNIKLNKLMEMSYNLETDNMAVTAKIKTLSDNIVKKLSDEVDLKSVVEIIENKSSDSFFTFTEEGIILAINNEAMNMFGYTLKEFNYLNMFDLIPMLSTSNLERAGLVGIGNNMVKFPIEISVSRISTNSTKLLAIVRNISDKCNLLEMDSFVKSLFHNSLTPMYHKDKHSRYVGCNAKFEELCGKPSSEIFGKTVYDLFPKDVAEFSTAKELELYTSSVLNDSKSYNCTIRTFNNPNNMSILVITTLIRDSHGNANGIIGTIVDLTDQIKCVDSSVDFNSVINETTSPLVVTDNDGFILFSNNTFSTAIGFDARDLTDFNISTFIGVISLENAVLITKSGQPIDYKLKIISLPSATGESSFHVYIFS